MPKVSLSIVTRTFLGFIVVLLAFGAVSSYSVAQLHRIGADLRVVNEGYLPLTKVLAQIETFQNNKARDINRILEVDDRRLRAVFIRLARLYFPKVIDEKLGVANQRVARLRRLELSAEDMRLVGEVESRLETVGTLHREYYVDVDRLFELLDAPPEEPEAEAQARLAEIGDLEAEVKRLEGQLAKEIKLLSLALEQKIARGVMKVERSQDRAVWAIIGLTVAATLVGLLVSLLAWWTLRPLRQLVDGVRRLARGEFDDPPRVRGGGELGLLAREFNEMAQALRQREEALAHLGAYNESIVESVRSGLVVTDAQLQVTSINRAAMRMWGLDAHAVRGRSLFELPLAQVERLRDPELREGIAQAAQGRGSVQLEAVAFPGRSSAGDGMLLLDLTVLPFVGEADAPAGVLLVAEDVTEKERVKAKLLHAERLAAIGRVAAQITHEVRNPLNAISLNADMLEDELSQSGGAEARSLLGSISREIDRLTAITEEYLRFARLPEPRLREGSVNDVLESLLDFMAEDLSSRGVRVQVELEASLPRVLADQEQLRQAFLNLLRNAAEAMPGGGALRVGSRRSADGVEIELRDSGDGIPEETLRRIFEPFFTTKAGGTGLGLALAQHIVAEHGGVLRIESRPGDGTAVTITLPAARSAGPRPAKSDSSAGLEASA